ncbi:MAG TPA: hypothetical protein PLZ77_09375, partial [Lachnospiraceae bacterium]|nr:hypothetical protein [Lachnospiraceae bacterium]
ITNMKSECSLVELPDITDKIKENILGTAVNYTGYTGFSGDSIDITNDILVDGTIGIFGPKFCGKGIIYATDAINLSCQGITNPDMGKVVLVSENSNINIFASNTIINGVIYAPNGTVTITGQDVVINGRIIAKNISFYGSNLTVNTAEDDLTLIESCFEKEDVAPVASLSANEIYYRESDGIADITMQDDSYSPDGDEYTEKIRIYYDSELDGVYETEISTIEQHQDIISIPVSAVGSYKAIVEIVENTETMLSAEKAIFFTVDNSAPSLEGTIEPERMLNVVVLSDNPEESCGDELVTSLNDAGYGVELNLFQTTCSELTRVGEIQTTTESVESRTDSLEENDSTTASGNGINLNDVVSSTENRDIVSLTWERTDGQTYPGNYRIQRRVNNGNYTSISAWDGVSTIRVLNVYPNYGSSDTFANWMKEPMGNSGSSADQGYFDIDKVWLVDFNVNPEKYLLDTNGEYQYDVIFCGASDGNGAGDLSVHAADCLHEFVDCGGGVLFGHDSVTTSKWFSYPQFASFAPKLGIICSAFWVQTGGCMISVEKEGTLTSFPWKLEGTMTVPFSHTSGQLAGGSLPGTVWMTYAGTPVNTDAATGATDGAYLVTNNQLALIQTGHSTN